MASKYQHTEEYLQHRKAVFCRLQKVNEVCDLLKINPKQLNELTENPIYNTFNIGKKSGGERLIEDPTQNSSFKKMSLLISYDIEENYLRQKIAHYIIDAGLERVQYSVYIGTVKDTVVRDVKEWLEQLPMDKNWKQNDSILILHIHPTQLQEMISIGKEKWDKDDLSGDRHTLIL